MLTPPLMHNCHLALLTVAFRSCLVSEEVIFDRDGLVTETLFCAGVADAKRTLPLPRGDALLLRAALMDCASVVCFFPAPGSPVSGRCSTSKHVACMHAMRSHTRALDAALNICSDV